MATVLSMLTGAAAARAAEPFPQSAERIASPGRNAASDESAEALALNPANLGYLPGAELRWTGLFCADSVQRVGCGHSVGLAATIFDLFGTGLRLDYVRPPLGAGFPYNGTDYAWLTWGFGIPLSSALAVGASVARSYSSNASTDGIVGLTAAASLRFGPGLALAAVVRDVNAPRSERLAPRGLPLLDRSVLLSAAIRPTGRRAFELGAEARYLEGADAWFPRLTLGIDVPRVGRLRADIEAWYLGDDRRRAFVGTAGLEVAWGPATLGGGVLAGSGLGTDARVAGFATASVATFREPGIPRPARAVYVRLETTPGTRAHVALLRRLWATAESREVAAVTLVVRAEPASSFAHAEELADAIRYLRARGKKVLCSLEDNGARALYVCANADRTVINPAGGLRYAGLRAQYFYLAKLLAKVGVRAEFVRIGAHKTAPEQFAREGASEVARSDHEDLLRQVEAGFIRNVAAGRRLSEARVRQETLRGPFIAREARDAGFVDGFAFDDELERVSRELVGRDVAYEKYEETARAHDTFGPRSKIALLYVDGDIIDGRSQRVPLLDMKMVGSYTMADTIKSLRDDPSVRSVVLRIESPGGSSMAADVIWRELAQLAKRKPLVVSMGSVAASGGYYIASAGRTVYALPLSVTGSIGIFYGKADASELLRKIGVNVDVYKTAPRADAESLFRPFTDDERRELSRKIGQFYNVFLDRVSRGRRLTCAEVDAVGQGRVWTGQQALQRGLVDRLGGLREALAEARAAAALPDDAPIEEYPSPVTSILDRLLTLAGVDARAPFGVSAIPAQLRDALRAVAPMAVYDATVPLARLEWVPSDVPASDDEAP